MFEKNRILVAGVYTEAEHDAFMSYPYETGKEFEGFNMRWGNPIYLGYEYHSTVAQLDVAENYTEVDILEEEQPVE